MLNLTTHHADLRAIAEAYKLQREAGAMEHTAFIAAVINYRQRQPGVRKNQAALVINQLIGNSPQGCTH